MPVAPAVLMITVPKLALLPVAIAEKVRIAPLAAVLKLKVPVLQAMVAPEVVVKLTMELVKTSVPVPQFNMPTAGMVSVVPKVTVGLLVVRSIVPAVNAGVP